MNNIKKRPELLYLHMDITVKCNLYCLYCFYGDYNNLEKIKEEVSLERLREIIDEAIVMGCKKIILSGGEVLTSEKFYPLLEYLNENNMKIIFITNGTLFGTEDLNKLVQFKENIDEIKISYDGSGNDIVRGNGTSEKVLSAIRMIDKAGFPWTLNTIITKYNYKYLDKIYDLLNELNPKYWRVDLPFSLGRYISNKSEIGFEQLEEVFVYIRDVLSRHIEEKPKFGVWMFSIYQPGLEDADIIPQTQNMHPCAYNKRNLGVRGNGEVTPCSRFLNLQLGNIKNNSIRDVKQSKEFKEFWDIKIGSISECKDCKYIYICGCGCRANAVAEGTGILGKDPVACAIMPLFEKYIIPLFSQETQECYNSLILKSQKVR